MHCDTNDEDEMKWIFVTMFLTMWAMIRAMLLPAESFLTLAQARAGALARSATLRRANLAVEAASLAEKTQGYDFLPSIAATVGAGVGYPSASLADLVQGTAGLTVNQAVYDGGKSALLTAIDRLDAKIARQEARAEYFGILQAVDTEYHGVLKARASVDAARSDLDAARTRLALATAKSDASMITKSALQEAKAIAASRETALIQAQGALAVAEAALSSLTGLAVPLSLQDVDFEGHDEVFTRYAALTTEGITAFLEGVQKAADANNPSLSQAALAAQRAKKSIELAGVGYLPTVSAAFSHTVSMSAAQGLSPGNGSLSITATIPLDLWTAKAGVDAKSIAARQTDLDEEESRRTFALQVKSGVYDCLSAARSVVSSTRALEYAEANYQGVLERYKLSAASSTDLSDAEALVTSSRAALISARYSFLDSFSSLRTLAGLETGELLAALLP
jgi:outer membrane protein